MDPLADLKDIHLPEDIPLWPLAPGWWIVITLIIALVGYGLYRFWQYRHYWRVKRQGLAFLSKSGSLSSAQILHTLKWVCLHYYPRQQVAPLHGEALLRFLLVQLPDDVQPKFKVLAQNAIVEHYRKNEHDIYAAELHKAAMLWCQQAKLPNSSQALSNGGLS
ncbi:DUF4381 domain-containing protein [Thalassotalea mangrovi]|uniref:DUF4381 domain-containing protein n=1 Tax=Thalassotalea mangrovi TaxID=2572245 RepID=UPI00145D1289|nr:DUF4381 domain-containing protein [Thalassotalea mangrovi]